MKCPRCGNEDPTKLHHLFEQYPELSRGHCDKCGYVWMDWQSSEISRLTAENAKLQAQLSDTLLLLNAEKAHSDAAEKEISLRIQRSDELQVKLSSLTRQLEEGKGEWRAGKPPKDGWYWIKPLPDNPVSIRGKSVIQVFHQIHGDEYEDDHELNYESWQWSGPIPQPGEEPKC